MKFGKIKETLRTNPLSNRSSKESYKKIGGNYLRNNSRKFPRAQEQLQAPHSNCSPKPSTIHLKRPTLKHITLKYQNSSDEENFLKF